MTVTMNRCRDVILSALVFFYVFGLAHAQNELNSISQDERTDSMSGSPSTSVASKTQETTSNTSGSSISTMPANTTATTPQLDVVDNMCFRWRHQSIIKNGSLYIDGGMESFSDNDTRWTSGPTTLGYNYHLIRMDLTQSFNWTEMKVPTQALNKTKDPDSGNQPPQISDGILFSGSPDDSKIWLYGGNTLWWNMSFPGFQYPTTQVYSLWSYDTAVHRWDQYDVSSTAPSRPSNGFAAEAPELGLSFYFNGELDSGSSLETMTFGDNRKQFLESIVVLNTTSQTAVNISTAAATGNYPRTRGGAAYIPGIGGSGILVLFGGTSKPVDMPDPSEVSGVASFERMDNITIFDVGAYLRNNSEPLWYAQNATGDIPPPRAYSCTVLVSTEDGTSHNMYVHAGQGPNNTVYDDVYVLSVPSFTWTRIYDSNNFRFGHTCHRVGDQMITVGGQKYTSLEEQLPCDWETAGVGIFNMSNAQWGSVFKPVGQTSAYTLPPKVRESIKEQVLHSPSTVIVTPLTV